jgi:hypothetical protein
MKSVHIPTLASDMGWFHLYETWLDLSRILFYLNQRDELEGLIEWAKRKRLGKIRNHYIELLFTTDGRLRDYQRYSQKVLFGAEWLHCVKKMLFPPRYYKGYASKYRIR